MPKRNKLFLFLPPSDRHDPASRDAHAHLRRFNTLSWRTRTIIYFRITWWSSRVRLNPFISRERARVLTVNTPRSICRVISA